MKSLSDNQEIISGTIIGVEYRDGKARVVFECDASEFGPCINEWAHIVRRREADAALNSGEPK